MQQVNTERHAREAAPVAERRSRTTTHHHGASANHTVRFYADDESLPASITEHVDGALSAGGCAIVIATTPHLDAVLRRLSATGCDVAGVRAAGRLIIADAREALSNFMRDDAPDAELFRASVGRIVTDTVRRAGGRGVRVYGEMVDVLWRDGDVSSALALEQLWNELAASHPFSLLCAYGMDNFANASDSDAFADVCREHGHVVPTETFTQIGEDRRLAEIARLQQRAAALEAELQHRHGLEQSLRAALAERDALLESERRARAEAEAANQAKSAFLATMSHELRTPLNAIGGYADLIECGVYGPLTDAQRMPLARIEHSQRHLLTLINDVLDFAKMQSGRTEYATTTVPLADVFTHVEELTAPLFHSRGIGCRFDASSLSVVADRDRLCQILVNLMSNASKYTDTGGEVAVRTQLAPSAIVEISVHDTGRGIPPAQLESVFDPFVQVGRTLSQPRDGVGLGLAISRDLAHAMGGRLTVTSELGAGSVFTLALPAA